jgi:tetratricopeptide (TPR) repeat protein/O-antigen ligase
MSNTSVQLNTTNLIRQAAITVVFSYVLLVGGTLNGLALYEAVNLSLVVLGLIGAIWLGWAWWCRRPLAFSPVTVVYGVYLAGNAVAAAFSLDPRRSLNALWLTTLYVLAWVLVSDLIRRGWPAELFARVMAVLATGVIGLALWQTATYELDWLAISGGTPLIPPVILRPNPLLTHANMVAAFLNLLFPIVLVGLLNSSTWPRRIIAGVWVFMAWMVILLTSSRGAWLGTAVALFVTVGLWWWAGRRISNFKFALLQGPVRQISNLKSQIANRKLGWLTAIAAILIGIAGVGAVAGRVLQSPTHGSGFGSRQAFWEAAWETFLAHPLTGQGPDTFATAYLRHISIPPNELYVRAHSQYMHLLAENGLLGILTGGALLFAVGWAGRRRWLVASVSERRLLAGIVGGLVATAVHSLFDTPPAVPINALVIATLAAILTAYPPAVERQRGAGWQRLVLTGLVIALLAAGAWMQRAYQPYLKGTAQANSDQWHAAAPGLEEAVAHDPGHALYNLASGYVHGVLAAQGDAGALPIAIRRYQAAIQREPGYGLNHANLAALYWQQGDARAALATMEQAVQAAPGEATFWLNLGLYREKTGDLAQAQVAYTQTLTLRPAWGEAYFWRANDLRRSILEAWRTAHPPQEPQTVADQAQVALASGRYDEALQLYNQLLATNSQWASGYTARATALMELGRYQEAARDARIAAFIGSLEPNAVIQSQWILAQIAYRQGERAKALELGERVLDAVRQQSIFGPGTYGTSLYGWAIFYRMGLSADMLPQLETIRYTDTTVEQLRTLGAWYEEAQDLASARRIYTEAFAAAPDAAWAKQRLQALGGP